MICTIVKTWVGMEDSTLNESRYESRTLDNCGIRELEALYERNIPFGKVDE